MNSSHTRCELRAWYAEPLGRALLARERRRLDTVLKNLFGYHLVQLGALSPDDLLGASRIGHRVVVDSDITLRPGIVGHTDVVPLAPCAVDVVVLPHTLEFAADPHEVLREVERILIPEGHVVIVAFNPWSLWGLWRVALKRRGRTPWCGQFLGLTRIKDWLALLGFDAVLVEPLFFRPPIKRQGVMRRLRFLEKSGARWWPLFAGVNIVVGKKRVATLTPIKPRWRPRRSLLPAMVKSPSGSIEHG